MTHFCNLAQKPVAGLGRRWYAQCRPCCWTGPWRVDKADANADYSQHVEVSS